MASPPDFDEPKNGSYNVNEILNDDEPFLSRAKNKADEFREFLATKFCTCLSSVPSFVLVILSVVLVMLLIATIPLAFAFTYMGPQSKLIDQPRSSVNVLRQYDFKFNNKDVIKDVVILNAADLLPANISSCNGFGFSCTSDPSIVIGANQRCDGVKDCGDGSDELGCRECQTTFSCKDRYGQKLCLRQELICGNHAQCADGFDQSKTFCNTKCASDEHKCEKDNVCYPEIARCDGDWICPGGDDEHGCKETDCKNGAKFCKSFNKCLPKWLLCNGEFDCPDRSDEQNCTCSTCSGNDRVLCNGESKLCIKANEICNGFAQCPAAEDEENCPGTCTPNMTNDLLSIISKSNSTKITSSKMPKKNRPKIRCGGKLYDWEFACGGGLHDGELDCENGCTECDADSAFDCFKNGKANETGRRCIHRSLVCNGHPDCANGLDEFDCSCGPTPFQCKKAPNSLFVNQRNCYNQTHKCDGFKDCPLGDDEMNCDRCVGDAVHCVKEKKCVIAKYRCDGKADCVDESDEKNCTCDECSAHPFDMYMCSSGKRCYRKEEVCNPYSKCPDPAPQDKLYCAVKMGNGHSYL